LKDTLYESWIKQQSVIRIFQRKNKKGRRFNQQPLEYFVLLIQF